MAEQKNETRQVQIMTLFCAIVMLIPFIAWWKQSKINMHNGWFVGVDIILTLAFIYMSRINARDARENETDTTAKRAITIAIAVADFFWVAGWAAFQNELIK